MELNRMSARQSYQENDPVCAEAPTTITEDANSLAAELEKRILGLAGSLDGFADGLLGGEVKAGEPCRENSAPPGELYRLVARLRAAHVAVTLAESAFERLRPVL